MKHLSVRPLERDDIPRIVDYWGERQSRISARMGADPEKIPRPDISQANMENIDRTVAEAYLDKQDRARQPPRG